MIIPNKHLTLWHSLQGRVLVEGIHAMRVVRVHSSDLAISRACPLVLERIRAGFPSPAEDYIDQPLDLNEHLIHHPAATFFVRVAGDSTSSPQASPAP